MSDENFRVVMYQFLLFELSRREDAVESYRHLMLTESAISYSVLKYFSALQSLEDFRVIFKKICGLLENFD